MGKGKAEGKEGNDIKAPAGGVQYQFAIKPVEKPGWEGFKEFIWNTETSEFLGRTGISWCKYIPRNFQEKRDIFKIMKYVEISYTY